MAKRFMMREFLQNRDLARDWNLTDKNKKAAPNDAAFLLKRKSL
jgi:hypothetical protein